MTVRKYVKGSRLFGIYSAANTAVSFDGDAYCLIPSAHVSCHSVIHIFRISQVVQYNAFVACPHVALSQQSLYMCVYTETLFSTAKKFYSRGKTQNYQHSYT